ncbi:carboxymuconolactone decarboxylase family protein [Actinacidiphila sp. bgisy145]|uniref:carboxymuconolactone decarboxylase family protein n=1 Tax=Actinacidiphila sp. bgisy145 TaxID=3413792 RepID=UPI003EC0AD65
MTSAKELLARLEDPTDFGTFGRFVETPVDEMPAAMREAYDVTTRMRGLVPGPHKIWLANPALSMTIVPTGAYFQTKSSLSKAEIEIVTNVINGRWGAAYSNFEHEKIGVIFGELDASQVESLITGRPTAFDDPRQQVVYELSSALAAARVVPKSLFRRAQELLGDPGIVDVTVLMGWFTAVCLTLMAYDVPSGAVGLEQ